MDRIGYPAGYMRFFQIRIAYLFLKKVGSGERRGTGYLCDFYDEISLKGDSIKMLQMMVVVISLLQVCLAFILKKIADSQEDAPI